MANHKKRKQKQKAFNEYVKRIAGPDTEKARALHNKTSKEHYCFTVKISHKQAEKTHNKRKPLSIEAQAQAYMRQNELPKNHVPRFEKPNRVKTYKRFSKT